MPANCVAHHVTGGQDIGEYDEHVREQDDSRMTEVVLLTTTSLAAPRQVLLQAASDRLPLPSLASPFALAHLREVVGLLTRGPLR